MIINDSIIEQNNCEFKAIKKSTRIPTYFSKTLIDYLEHSELEFDNCEFKIPILFEGEKYKKSFKQLIFKRCVFTDEFRITHSTIEGIVNFEDPKFEHTVNFENCIFNGEINFSNVEFKNIASFDNAIFNNYVDFNKARFNKIANFSNAQFKKDINFSGCSFDSGVNLINSKLNFEFEDLKNAIKNVSIDNPNGKQPITEVANNFRDSFRAFKSSLIKDNNNLDAANFHRAELYCKEIELKLKTQKTWRNVFDWWQLVFYRITSDHHTDLFRILLWTLGVMGIFGTINLYLNIFIILLIVSLFLFGLNKMISDRVDFVAFSLFSIAGIYMFLCEPNTINPVNFLNTDGESNKIAMAIRVIYTLIIGLLLFSLQKTARKNSIVPS